VVTLEIRNDSEGTVRDINVLLLLDHQRFGHEMSPIPVLGHERTVVLNFSLPIDTSELPASNLRRGDQLRRVSGTATQERDGSVGRHGSPLLTVLIGAAA
jgi:hypothetical protein